MSNQDHNNQHFPSTNPWHDEESQSPYNQQAQPQNPYPPQGQQQQGQQGQQQYGSSGGFAPPPGPPPGQTASHPPGQGLNRGDSFKETDFIPESQRGEQREAMQQFEMNKSGNESQQDRDVAQLQQEFPSVDGSLIAALYSDSGNMGATKEMLMELANQAGGQGSS